MQQKKPPSLSMDRPHVRIERIVHNIEKVIIGKRETIEYAVTALLCGGHVLLEDVPGVGKTTFVRALSRTVDCSFQRVQFTPDLLPSDVTGMSVYNQRTGDFEYRPGPLMANLVLADELNRTSPRTQSAMLEAMEEKRITVDGSTYPLPEPFWILATQNPLDYEGTFNLPEAQLDRFFMRIRLGYPDPAQEAELLGRQQDKHPVEGLRPVILKEELVQLQKQVRGVHVDETLKQYIVSLAAATRSHPDIRLGMSPRASIALMRAAQARAFCQNRSYVIPDDIKSMFRPVVAHRLILSTDARLTGVSGEDIAGKVAAATQVPVLRFVR